MSSAAHGAALFGGQQKGYSESYRGAEIEVMLPHADRQATDDVDHQDQDAGYGVAADELGCTVHGTIEIGLATHLFAPHAGLCLIDQAGIEIRIDRHLLARHGVQGETGGHLGDASGPLGDDHEIDDHQDGEDDHPDDVVPAHHEVPETLDHLAGGTGRGRDTERAGPADADDASGGTADQALVEQLLGVSQRFVETALQPDLEESAEGRQPHFQLPPPKELAKIAAVTGAFSIVSSVLIGALDKHLPPRA